jgi:hypothetical protein
MMECLDMAAEMDARAAEYDAPATHEACAQYRALSRGWRALAIRALRQDTWADMIRLKY